MERWSSINKLVSITCLIALSAIGCSARIVLSDQARATQLAKSAEELNYQGYYRKAVDTAQTGLTFLETEDQSLTRAILIANLAIARENMGEYLAALADATECVSLAKQNHHGLIHVQCLITAGQIHRRTDNYESSLPYLEQAEKRITELNDAGLQSELDRNFGALYQNMGQSDRAFSTYQKALQSARVAGDRRRIAKALNNIGGIHRQRGEYQDAKDSYEESLAISQEVYDLGGQSSTHGNLCGLYNNLREFGQALTHCKTSRRIAKKIGAMPREATSLNNMASIYRYKGRLGRARKMYERSASLKKEMGLKQQLAQTYNNIGELYLYQNNYTKAEHYFQLSIEIKSSLGDLAGLGSTHSNIGSLYLSKGETAQAFPHLWIALENQSALDVNESLWRTLANISRAYVQSGNQAAAIFFGKLTVNTLQSLRLNIQDLGESPQKTYLEDKQIVYEELAELLIQDGRLLEAQQIMSMLKEEEYFDFIDRSSGPNPGISNTVFIGAVKTWNDRYEEIKARLVNIAREYEKLMQDPDTPENSLLISQLDSDLKFTRRAFHYHLEKIKNTFEELSGDTAREFGERDLNSLVGFKGTLEQLGHGAVLVHYLMTEQLLHIIVTSPSRDTPPLHFESKIGKAALNKLIYEYREILQDPNLPDPFAKAQELYNWILQPIASYLKELQTQTLMVYLHRGMRYLPLSALHDGKEYVAERYPIVVFTSAMNSEIRTDPVQQWRVAGLGVSDSTLDFSALDAVIEELDVIVREEGNEKDSRGILPGNTFMNKAFTAQRLQRVLREDPNPYTVIHIATHFTFQPGTYDNSFLLLGDDKLSLEELRNGGFPMTNVDLLTLSACETALGGENLNGREVEGLGKLAQNLGVKAVIATLWKVNDSSTGQFMQSLYHLRKEDDLNKAEALRQAQVNFIRGKLSIVDTIDSDRGTFTLGINEKSGIAPEAGYVHPYYWAPFILMGNFL